MQPAHNPEDYAMRRLIAQIDSLDAWRDRIPRRILVLFALTFAFALGLLVYVAAFDGPHGQIRRLDGPRAPVVLHSARP